MKIFTCLKTVPGSCNVQFDSQSGTMIREGNQMVINPYDLTAIEAALSCAQACGGTVEGVSMGVPSSESALRTALAMGVRELHLLTSPAFAGADVLATAYTLSAFFQNREYDLIICGKHSADGDTGQVGGELAEHLNIPHAGCVSRIISIDKEYIVVEQRLEHRVITLRLPFPCLIIIENDMMYPHIPSLTEQLKAKRLPIHCWNEKTIPQIQAERCGLAGASTSVVRIETARKLKKIQWIESDRINQISDVIQRYIKEGL